jgi:hypothetical protein
MIVDKQGTIPNKDLFKAVLNGFKIDLTQVKEQESGKDDELEKKTDDEDSD